MTATALLCWALLAFMKDGAVAQASGVFLGTVLGLSRPYDLVLLVAVRLLAVLLSEPRRRWPRCCAPLAGFLPVVGYLYWLYYRSGAFATFFSGYVTFPALDLVVAFAPALLLLAAVFRPRPRGSDGW